MILDIPIEILNVVFRIEKDDPLKPLMDVVNSNNKIESNSQSVHRLDALSRSYSSIEYNREFTTLVVRDLWKGKYWTMKEKDLSLDDEFTGSIHQLEPIQRLDVTKSEGEVKELATPFLGWLAGESKIDRKNILRHVRLESLESKNEVIFLKTKISQKEDGLKRKFWVYEDGPFKQLIGDYIDKESGFEMEESVMTETEHEWPYSPEIKALRSFKKKPNKENALNILDTILEQIKNDDRPRLDWVKQVVGFRQDMWDAAQEVILSAKKQVFIVTSFSNPSFSDDMAELLAESSAKMKPNILLSFGEPERGRSPKDIQNTEEYISTLAKDRRFKLKGGISPKSNHAKLVISDTGMAFISSCNLFSGSLDSGVLESGLLINDINCVKSMLEVSNKEDWVPNQLIEDINKMNSDLEKINHPNFVLSDFVEKQIAEIKNDIIKSDGDWYAYIKLERLLRDIAERPTWSFIRTLEHRPFMADCIERFGERIVMASDGLKSNGLDKATIQRIGQRASKNKASVHIWWGRHAPKSRPFDEVDKRGRREAKKQLQQLRQAEGRTRVIKGEVIKGKVRQIHEKGFGFILLKGKRVFISPKFVKKHGLKSGDSVEFIEKNVEGKKSPEVKKFTKVRGESVHRPFQLLPLTSNEPMETHAKLFIVDDTRLMISSDNTLSFGDTESERSDAGELGIMIDHPRLALQTRGSMELWIPDEAKIRNDLARWWALLGEEISLHTHKPSGQISLIGALDSMIERIESNEYLRIAWEQEVEEISNRDELTIINKLVLGVRFGIYCIAKNMEASGIKSKLTPEQVEKSVISLSRNNMWEDSK